MTKRRMISEDFFQSESIAELTMRQRLLVLGIIANADDQGRIRGHPQWLRSRIFPYDDFATKDIEDDLQVISKTNDTILLYKAKGKRCIQLTNWWEYQTHQWAKPSDLLAPEEWKDRIRMMIYKPKRWIMTLNWSGVADCIEYKVIILPNELDDVLPIINININIKEQVKNFTEEWSKHFPNKSQPRPKTITNKLKIRLKDKYFCDNWKKALSIASGSDYLNNGGFFTALWFLKNEENWEKCLDGNYQNNRNNRPAPEPSGIDPEMAELGRIKKREGY